LRILTIVLVYVLDFTRVLNIVKKGGGL